MDMGSHKLINLSIIPAFISLKGISPLIRRIEYHIRKCDVVLPLVAIATPALYVSDPLRVLT